MISAERREVAMDDDVASKSTQAVANYCTIFADKGKEDFPEYKSKIQVLSALYSNTMVDVFQGKA